MGHVEIIRLRARRARLLTQGVLHHLFAGSDQVKVIGDADDLYRVRQVSVGERCYDLGVEFHRVELPRERLVLGAGNVGPGHDPLADVLRSQSVILAGRDGVQAPMDEHAEARFAPPPHPLIALRVVRGRAGGDGRTGLIRPAHRAKPEGNEHQQDEDVSAWHGSS